MDRGLLGVDSFEEKEGEIMETKGTTLRVSLTRSSSIVFNSRAAINIFDNFHHDGIGGRTFFKNNNN